MRSIKGIQVVVLGVTAICLFCSAANGAPWIGTGEPNEPYLIYDANDMQAIGADSNYWGAHFKLMADINLIAYDQNNFKIIGNIMTQFTGVFDGNDHTISNFTWGSSQFSDVGLFSVVGGPDAEIKYLRLTNPNIQGYTNVGTLVGRMLTGTITSCGIEGGLVSGYSTHVGGLVGYNGYGTITNCYSTGSVLGADDPYGDTFTGGLVGISHGILSNCYTTGLVLGYDGIGGLVGCACGYNSTITNCYAIGPVDGDNNVGGLAGSNGGTIAECYAAGSVSGNNVIGGLVGHIYNSDGIISDCYAAGSVNGNGIVGGLVGKNDYGTIINSYSAGPVDGNGGLVGFDLDGAYTSCFWDSDVNPDVNGIGNSSDANVIGESTANMQIVSTFTDAGWDFVGEVINGPNDIWKICEGESYPQLWYEKFGGGLGDADNPYLIYTSCQMNEIGSDSNYWGAHFKLMADINLIDYNETNFNIIGDYPDNPFTGVFDGNGHAVSNFSYVSQEAKGLFGYANDPNAEIRDISIIAADVNARPVMSRSGKVGALIGFVEYCSITGCDVIDSKVRGYREIGGLVGLNSFGEIQDCKSVGTIVIGEHEYIGGLIGRNGGSVSHCCSRSVNIRGGYYGYYGGLVGLNEGTISECYTRSSTINGEWEVGGLVGFNDSTGFISSCYSADNTVTGEYLGGLVGDNIGIITNCHSDCLIVGGGGGLVGYPGGDISKCYSVGRCIGSDWYYEWIDDCFWNIDTADRGMNIGIESSTAEMMTMNTYTDAGWDFNTPVWVIDEGNDYPRLWWEEVVSPGRYGGGRGLPAEPYLIYDANDMQSIGANRIDWHKHFKLMADIDLGCYSGEEFNIIGEYLGIEDPYDMPFIGTFDGDGHTISNFTYSTEENGIGIFEYIAGANSVIRDLGLIDPNVHGGDVVGSLVARQGFFGGGITNCYVEGGVVSGGTTVGGLIGSSCSFVLRCYSTASVIGGDAVGGLAGMTRGYNDGWGSDVLGGIMDCYSRGEVSGDRYIGGLVGFNYKSPFDTWTPGFPAKISNCYSTGAVSGNDDVGGLIGLNNGDVNDCFWDVNSSGQASSSGGTGKTTAEMQTRETFTDAGWDFVGEVINGPNDVWRMCVDGVEYPKLWWEFNTADFVCPDGVNFVDFAVLAETWLLEEGDMGYNPVCDISSPADERIDMSDLEVFTENWLGEP